MHIQQCTYQGNALELDLTSPIPSLQLHTEGPTASPIHKFWSHCDIMRPLTRGGAVVPLAGLHKNEGNSLATFLSVTGGAF